jgi:CBS domain-containing protein
MTDDILAFLLQQPPFSQVDPKVLEALAPRLEWRDLEPPARVYAAGEILPGMFLIRRGRVSVSEPGGAEVSTLGPGNAFGERGLLSGGTGVTSARVLEPTRVLLIPADVFAELLAGQAAIRDFYDRSRRASASQSAEASLMTAPVSELMVPDAARVAPGTTMAEAAAVMRERRISSVFVCDDAGCDGGLRGIVTLRDLGYRVLTEGMAPDTPVDAVMARDLRTLPPTALGSDVLHMMAEHGLGHLPVVEDGRLLGIVTQSDLMRFQARSSAFLVKDVARAGSADGIAEVTRRIPGLLAQLVGAGHRHDTVTRLITDVADVATRRLLALAEDRLGPAPCAYAWLACGSQGRQEQTGVSDQDNCLIWADDAPAEAPAYFEALAREVTLGLDAAGYVLCPGDMMASNPRWRQPLSVWRGYFDGWIAKPGKEAQMLASVMFDLRTIGGDASFLDRLREGVLRRASRNSIFTAHMASNALGHQPPLGLLRGLATIRSGEHRDTIDLKMNGVVPVVDLGRVYALQGGIGAVNTRARIEAARQGGSVSQTGARDLLDAYDLIAQTRLEHQAALIRRGAPPDNYLSPASLSDFERSHLRDAFVVVKTMQAAMMQGRGALA